MWAGASKSALSLWTLINAAGACEVAVNSSRFDSQELEDLRERLGLSRDIIDEPFKATDILGVYPRVIPWWYAHFYPVALVLLVVAIVVGAAV